MKNKIYYKRISFVETISGIHVYKLHLHSKMRVEASQEGVEDTVTKELLFSSNLEFSNDKKGRYLFGLITTDVSKKTGKCHILNQKFASWSRRINRTCDEKRIKG